MSSISKAVETWLKYEDSDRFDEDKARELTKARIEVREALRKGYRLVDLEKLEELISHYEVNCILSNNNDYREIFSEIRKFIQKSTE